jgi:hypothetical protein
MTAAERYIATGHRAVQGWLTDTARLTIVPLVRAQDARGITGPVCEIGVHHGRLFILLHLLAIQERAVGWDLFEGGQKENVDHSGGGSQLITQENIRTHGGALDRVRLVAANSLHLAPEDVVRDCGGHPRIFSIDGGHTAEITENDLRLADATVCDGGLVILDDCFNESWPGVMEGTARFLATSSRLVPAVIGGNKLILTTSRDDGASYQRILLSARAETRAALFSRGLYDLRQNAFFGADVLSISAYRLDLKKRLLHHPAYLAVRRLMPV